MSPNSASSTYARRGDGRAKPNQFPPGPESSPWLIVLDWGHMCVPRWCF